VPLPIRKGLTHGLGSGDWFGRMLERATPYLPMSLRLKDPKGKARKLIDALGAATDDERYRLLVSQWSDPASVVIGGREPPIALNDPAWRSDLNDPVERMMYSDLMTYLPDDILTKVDRASMAVGLEARVPLLDHRVVEFAWRVPMHQKVRDGQGKWLLRQVLYQYVPKSLIGRPKQGFGGPVHQWLRGPLRDWAEALLSEDRLRREGYFDPVPIRSMWADHLSGRVDEPHRLWGVLMFQAWLESSSRKT
jgi:asparagine synthase (glutamine-hydrolysing)